MLDCGHWEGDNTKPRVVLEIKGGALFAIYADVDAEFILVDWDEIEGGASAQVTPDKLREMPELTKICAEDAVQRPR